MTQLKISKMSGKLKGIKAINTNTLTNSFCQNMHKSKNKDIICKYCYSYYMLSTFRKNCQKSFENNSKLLSESIIPVDKLPVFNDLYVRLHAHGELINKNHLINFCNICRKNPKTTFVLWSKRTDIINKVFLRFNKPKNLILVYSNPKINNIAQLPKYFDKTFNVFDHKTNKTNCDKNNCLNCLKCYEINKHKVIVEKIKSYTKR